MRRSLFVWGLAGVGLALAGLVGCYTVDFDETKPEVYYCEADSDCGSNQACQRFRCVDDSGPQLRITLPEPLTPIDVNDTTLVVDYAISNFTVSDSNENIDGQGKLLVSIDDGEFSTLAVTEDGIALDISPGLEPGAHRLRIQAVFGDGVTPYENPGASAYVAFFVEEKTQDNQDSLRPQIAITKPDPNHIHVVGEPLGVAVAVRNFEIVNNGNDCHIDDGCDPWNEETLDCAPACFDIGVKPAGHAHIYIEPDYPACLFDTPIGCNGDYILSLRPSETVESNGSEASAVIPANRFNEPGTYTFSASLQYSDHDPYPNADFVIFDQITLIVE